MARSIREEPKGFAIADCDVALITVNSIFLPRLDWVSVTLNTASFRSPPIQSQVLPANFLIFCSLSKICIFYNFRAYHIRSKIL